MAFRASAKNFRTTAGDTILDKPAGTAEFDTIVIQGVYDGGPSNGEWTWPSGFTQQGEISTSSGDEQTLVVATKIAGASEPSTYTVGCSATFGAITLAISSYSGRHHTAPIGAVQSSIHSGLSASPITLGLTGVTAAAGDDLVVITAIGTQDGPHRWTMTPPTGYSEREDYSPQDWSMTALATKDNVSAGATGTINTTATQTVGSQNSGWLGFVLALKVEPSGSSSGRLVNGNLIGGNLIGSLA